GDGHAGRRRSGGAESVGPHRVADRAVWNGPRVVPQHLAETIGRSLDAATRIPSIDRDGGGRPRSAVRSEPGGTRGSKTEEAVTGRHRDAGRAGKRDVQLRRAADREGVARGP